MDLWFLTSAQTTNRASGCSWAIDLYRVLEWVWDHRYQHGFWHKACIPALHSVATWATDTSIDQAMVTL